MSQWRKVPKNGFFGLHCNRRNNKRQPNLPTSDGAMRRPTQRSTLLLCSSLKVSRSNQEIPSAGLHVSQPPYAYSAQVRSLQGRLRGYGHHLVVHLTQKHLWDKRAPGWLGRKASGLWPIGLGKHRADTTGQKPMRPFHRRPSFKCRLQSNMVVYQSVSYGPRSGTGERKQVWERGWLYPPRHNGPSERPAL